MCDPVTIAATVAGAAKSGLQIMSTNASLEAQGESVNNQLQREYIQQAYDFREQAEATVDEGTVADVNKQKAAGSARVKGAALGIRGTTREDLVTEQVQIGNFNLAGARDSRRQAEAAHDLGTSLSFSNAKDELNSIQAQAPTAFESVLNISAGGLQGYLVGGQINDALDKTEGSLTKRAGT